MKEFSKYEIASIKRTAQNVSAMMSKRNKLNDQLSYPLQAFKKTKKIILKKDSATT